MLFLDVCCLSLLLPPLVVVLRIALLYQLFWWRSCWYLSVLRSVFGQVAGNISFCNSSVGLPRSAAINLAQLDVALVSSGAGRGIGAQLFPRWRASGYCRPSPLWVACSQALLRPPSRVGPFRFNMICFPLSILFVSLLIVFPFLLFVCCCCVFDVVCLPRSHECGRPV